MGVWWKNLRETDKLENLDAYGRVILKCILRKYFEKTWIGLISLTERRSSILLWTRQ